MFAAAWMSVRASPDSVVCQAALLLYSLLGLLLSSKAYLKQFILDQPM